VHGAGSVATLLVHVGHGERLARTCNTTQVHQLGFDIR
jgi:hypothetical protein